MKTRCFKYKDRKCNIKMTGNHENGYIVEVEINGTISTARINNDCNLVEVFDKQKDTIYKVYYFTIGIEVQKWLVPDPILIDSRYYSDVEKE